ncbi:hypothetical protein BJ912DRAFT_1065176 [Pholiota molesta]|nr:hypothetical protein BJ912DRAFT_1065176 [Pholiota molesta]
MRMTVDNDMVIHVGNDVDAAVAGQAARLDNNAAGCSMGGQQRPEPLVARPKPGLLSPARARTSLALAKDLYVAMIGFSASKVTLRIFINVADFPLTGAGANDIAITPNSTTMYVFFSVDATASRTAPSERTSSTPPLTGGFPALFVPPRCPGRTSRTGQYRRLLASYDTYEAAAYLNVPIAVIYDKPEARRAQVRLVVPLYNTVRPAEATAKLLHRK